MKAKIRLDSNGTHLFDRVSGLNVLISMPIPDRARAIAPRFVSMALLNACDLSCPFCYAPKFGASLPMSKIQDWVVELDSNGTLGIGFGGGEPTLRKDLAEICRWITMSTPLSVSVTTHGHRFTPSLRNALVGNVNFIRLSVDGTEDRYQAVRGRQFSALVDSAKVIADTAPFGINMVVNDGTVRDLDRVADFAERVGAAELLLLPQVATSRVGAAVADTILQLSTWILSRRSGIRLAISAEAAVSGISLAQAFVDTDSLTSYAHISADGQLKRSSYDIHGTRIASSVMGALRELRSIGGLTE